MGEIEIKRVLTVGTLPQQLSDSFGKVIEGTAGSGILDAYIGEIMENKGIDVWKFYPSHFSGNYGNRQKTKTLLFGGEKSPFNFDIPVFTSTPCSQFRFDQMTAHQFTSYIQAKAKGLYAYIEEIESKVGKIDVVHTHHIFDNNIAMAMVNQTRMRDGKKPLPVVSHAHGTDLKFLITEKPNYFQRAYELKNGQTDVEIPLTALASQWEMGNTLLGMGNAHNTYLTPIVYEYIANRYGNDLGPQALAFLKSITEPKITGLAGIVPPSLLGVGAIIAISPDIKKITKAYFPDYPEEAVVMIPNGFKPEIFYKKDVSKKDVLSQLTPTATSSKTDTIPLEDHNPDYLVAFTGKFADWKGVDTLLGAAKIYENYMAQKGKKVVTIVTGSGPEKAVGFYEGLAETVGLRHTYFMGQVPASIIAMINNAADVGVYPSFQEPFGLVLLECLACGTPAIWGSPGGWDMFANETVGKSINIPSKDSLKSTKVIETLSSTIIQALEENWKAEKGEKAIKIAAPFTWEATVSQTIKDVYLPAISGENNYRPERLSGIDFDALMDASLKQLHLSPESVKIALLQKVPEINENASVAAELVKCNLKSKLAGDATTENDVKKIRDLIKTKIEKMEIR